MSANPGLGGGIVGVTTLLDCIYVAGPSWMDKSSTSASKWFQGPIAWLLADSRRLPFVPYATQLSLATRALIFRQVSKLQHYEALSRSFDPPIFSTAVRGIIDVDRQ